MQGVQGQANSIQENGKEQFKRMRSEERKVFEYFNDTPKMFEAYEKANSTFGGSNEAIDHEFTGDERPTIKVG